MLTSDGYVVLSKKKQHDDSFLKAKSFTASIAVHGSLLATIAYFAQHHPIILPKEEFVVISLSDYPPTMDVSPDQTKAPASKNTPEPKQLPPKKQTASTSQTSPSSTPVMDSSEALLPQLSSVRPSVVPSDLAPKSADLPHSTPPILAPDSPKITPTSLTNELPKSNVSSEEINGATLGHIRAMIESGLKYPSVARKLRLEGVVVISFILKRDGIVEKVEILTSSGSTLLDAKAIQTVLDLSGDYPTLPKTALLTIPISFSLTKS